jgi:hypothetical protein
MQLAPRTLFTRTIPRSDVAWTASFAEIRAIRGLLEKWNRQRSRADYRGRRYRGAPAPPPEFARHAGAARDVWSACAPEGRGSLGNQVSMMVAPSTSVPTLSTSTPSARR